MEVILVQPVKTLGHIGQVVKVKDGYGRNYLIPKGKAIRATLENKKLIEVQKAQLEQRNNEDKAEAAKISSKLNGEVFNVIRQAGDDGRLYGSVNPKEIAKFVSEKFSGIKHTNIDIKEPIKAIGIHEVGVVLHSDVQTKIFMNIARTESEAQDALRIHTQANQPQEKTTAA
jgi:large subunit ribosomal protein L9